MLISLGSILFVCAFAADSPRPIELRDILGWKRIQSEAVSSDGQWFAYRLSPNEGDSEVVVKNLRDSKETKYPAGEAPVPNFFGPEPPAPPPPALVFSDDGKWLAITVHPSAKETKRLKKEKKPLYDNATLVELATGKKTEFEKVRRFAFSGKRSAWVALHMPANYEEGKSYPTIVFIYEKLSQRLNSYDVPSASGFNPSVYTSNGYAVLMPDITYKVDDPGMSAVWCVLPAVKAAIATGIVDGEHIGIHGHSWGGYQTAFLITQTDAFAAAVADAPLTDMVSMYSSIYWNSGWANQPIFESDQGRFSAGYWDNRVAYIRNSPVYHARNVKTPLLILHNDKDGAVDWTQGIEYFNTLRRLHKPVVLLQYKGENHGLRVPANQKDYTVRMREFFDHYLKDTPAPKWLVDGIPLLKVKEELDERVMAKKP